MDEKFRGIILSQLEELISEMKNFGKPEQYNFEELRSKLEKTCLLINEHRNDSPEVIYDLIIKDYISSVEGISKLVPGFSTAIKDNESGIEFETYSGKTTEDGNKITASTRFDFASITKLFTAIEDLKLAEEGRFDRDELVKNFKNGKYPVDIPARDLERFTRRLFTNGRIDGNLTKDEFERRLKGVKVDYESIFEYNDIPYILLKDIMPTDDDYFKRYYQDEMKLLLTSYKQFGEMTGGNSVEIDKPYDSKAKNMMKYGYSEPGHAGIFGTSRELVRLFDNLKSGFLSRESLIDLTRTGHPNVSEFKLEDGKTIYINRAMGVYINHPSGLAHSEVVPFLGSNAFSAEGSSGGYSTFDLQNGFTANFLANPYSRKEPVIFEIDNSKHDIMNGDKPFEDGTLLRLFGTKFEIVDQDGNPIKKMKDGKEVLDKKGNPVMETVSFTRITNELKEKQIITLILLRLANKFLYKRAELLGDQVIQKELDNSSLGKNSKKVMHL